MYKRSVGQSGGVVRLRAAVANSKGGAGKTTTAVSIGAALADEGVRVLLVDLDKNGTATKWAGGDETALYDVFLDRRSIVEAAVEVSDHFAVIGSGEWTGTAERQVFGEAGADRLLGLALDAAEEDGNWDIAIIDCPPDTGLLETNGLLAATEVWAAVATGAMELDGADQLAKLVAHFVAKRLTTALAITMVIPCRFDARTRLDAEVVEALAGEWGDRVTVPVPQSVKVSEAYSHRTPITKYAPLSPPAIAYREIAKGLL